MVVQKYSLNFLSNIAQFVYVVIAVDGTVREEEEQKLLELFNTIWKAPKIFTDSEIEHINRMYLQLKKEEKPTQLCFENFIEFKNNNESLFSDEIKNMLWETACIVTSEVNNKNKSELIFLVKLERELKK